MGSMIIMMYRASRIGS